MTHVDDHTVRPLLAARAADFKALLALATLALLLGGCMGGGVDLEGPAERTSGPDATRAGAKEISLGATIFDDVSKDDGDTTDWKYITVPGRGVVTIKINFDNPKALAEMYVTDARGQILSVYKDENRGVLDNITFKAETGLYYMQITSSGIATSYSMEVSFSSL